jgi:23S rRNA pseudouridine1911/1915/1917 synthase
MTQVFISKPRKLYYREMLSLNTSCGFCGVSTATKAFQFHFRTSSSPFFFSPTNNYKFRSSIAKSVSTFSDDSNSKGEPKSNYSGVRLEEIVGIKSGKLRLDSWISSRINGISRARVQSSIKAGLVHVNGRVVDKVVLNSIFHFNCSEFVSTSSLITTNFLIGKV